MTVYHGGSDESLKNIEKNGFDEKKIGTGYGTTYGDGFYFSTSKVFANTYSDYSGRILEVKICANLYELKGSYLPLSRYDRLKIKKEKAKAISEGKNGFIVVKNTKLGQETEIILFNKSDIKEIKLINV